MYNSEPLNKFCWRPKLCLILPVWKILSILITLGRYYEIERYKAYMNFRERSGCKREGRVRSGLERERLQGVVQPMLTLAFVSILLVVPLQVSAHVTSESTTTVHSTKNLLRGYPKIS